MKSIIIEREILPEPLISYFRSPQVRLNADGERVILSPLIEKKKLFDLGKWLSVLGLATTGYRQKRFTREKAADNDRQETPRRKSDAFPYFAIDMTGYQFDRSEANER
ncbi:hypothetical protein FACS1894139_01740 [Planctomycetales bacterium]|nr:hypothetical protein FACS1894107_10480 [Planctomycetales bacterium]GHT02816.1 hypothetical protein FACS1894139_01740 [Planctomycetales bacterium]